MHSIYVELINPNNIYYRFVLYTIGTRNINMYCSLTCITFLATIYYYVYLLYYYFLSVYIKTKIQKQCNMCKLNYRYMIHLVFFYCLN